MSDTALATVGSAANVVTVEKGLKGEPDVRKFDVAALNESITQALAAIPQGKTVAAFGRVDLKGARLTIAGRVPSKSIPGELDWTIYVDKPWGGEFDAGIGLRWSI
jgi:hypothetical protein